MLVYFLYLHKNRRWVIDSSGNDFYFYFLEDL